MYGRYADKPRFRCGCANGGYRKAYVEQRIVCASQTEMSQAQISA